MGRHLPSYESWIFPYPCSFSMLKAFSHNHWFVKSILLNCGFRSSFMDCDSSRLQRCACCVKFSSSWWNLLSWLLSYVFEIGIVWRVPLRIWIFVLFWEKFMLIHSLNWSKWMIQLVRDCVSIMRKWNWLHIFNSRRAVAWAYWM